MMSNSPLIESLIQQLRCLPGVGPKSAQRMAYHLLQHRRQDGLKLASTMSNALESISNCHQCNHFTEMDLCHYCSHSERHQETVCVVEMPNDISAIEQTGVYRGLYYVLMGHLSPLDGIGPEELHCDKLLSLIQRNTVKEVILALNPTVEGEATAYYLMELLKPYPVKISKLAHGIPMGSELEYVDGTTISRALTAREIL